MSITLDGEALFDTGPAQVDAGPVELRQAGQDVLDGRGVRVVSAGQRGRRLTQTGMLIADTIAELEARLAAIVSRIDGLPRVLVDQHERAWPGVVMLRFEPGVTERLGPRWRCRYRIEYVQTSPAVERVWRGRPCSAPLTRRLSHRAAASHRQTLQERMGSHHVVNRHPGRLRPRPRPAGACDRRR